MHAEYDDDGGDSNPPYRSSEAPPWQLCVCGCVWMCVWGTEGVYDDVPHPSIIHSSIHPPSS